MNTQVQKIQDVIMKSTNGDKEVRENNVLREERETAGVRRKSLSANNLNMKFAEDLLVT